jgi:2-haloacid dehalogenase
MIKIQAKAMVFDAYGTLFNINSLDRILTENFGDHASELSFLWRKKQLEYTWLRTMMGNYKPFSEVTMDALTSSCNTFGLTLTSEIRDRLRKEYLKLEAYPEVPKVLESLYKQASIGVLSNANVLMLKGAIERNKLAKFFSHIISVEEISLFKPRREVYQLACTKFQLEPEQILFVSSNTWDAVGAKSFGLKVAWLNRAGTVMDELDFKPDFVLDEMVQLLEV